jgi:hypothetical protein
LPFAHVSVACDLKYTRTRRKEMDSGQAPPHAAVSIGFVVGVPFIVAALLFRPHRARPLALKVLHHQNHHDRERDPVRHRGLDSEERPAPGEMTRGGKAGLRYGVNGGDIRLPQEQRKICIILC